ncbi:prepro-urotensin II-beta-like [Coregonus clupeaformis]|uniref:Urotensin II n=1 Tax=Coregonus suidteri TaxID=861788 RepID=A0AAN8QYM2_9TELE|nr:prepro-urotensin II-beta-like [Coregonus clupeaformis]
MQCKRLLSCILLLTAAGPLLTHPVSHSKEMSYTGTASVEEGQVVRPEESSLSDNAYRFHSAPGLGDLRSAVFSPNQDVRDVLLETPALSPLTRFLGSRREYRKRTTTECFWKYCV